MHPAMMYWWKQRHGGCGDERRVGEGGGESWEPRFAGGGHGGDGGGAFGVRRPLRFLAYKLQLSEQQVGELAQILNELKTERAQAAVDDRRVINAFADVIGGEAFDEAKASEAGQARVKSAEQLRGAVHQALRRIHALLDPGQRSQLAYLIRTGSLTI
jgi:hypothetical protein